MAVSYSFGSLLPSFATWPIKLFKLRFQIGLETEHYAILLFDMARFSQGIKSLNKLQTE